MFDTSLMEKLTGSALQDTQGKIAFYEMKALETVVPSLDPSVSMLGMVPVGNLVTTDDPTDLTLQGLDAMPVTTKITAAAFPVNALIAGSDYLGETLLDRVNLGRYCNANLLLDIGTVVASQQRVFHNEIVKMYEEQLHKAGLKKLM